MLRQRPPKTQTLSGELADQQNLPQASSAELQIQGTPGQSTTASSASIPKRLSRSELKLGKTTSRDKPTPPVADDLEDMRYQDMSRKSQWIVLAVASGACAAFNGVFAKLTTTELTTTWATGVSGLFGYEKGDKGEVLVEVVIRAIFFGLNLIFNGIMWTLFTKALARGTSTTQVSIINTSSNFMITAVLGFIIFSESLPALWWLGAMMLVAGNVIIGRREETEAPKDPIIERTENSVGSSGYEDDEVDRLLSPEAFQLDDDVETLRTKQNEDDSPHLDLHDDSSRSEDNLI